MKPQRLQHTLVGFFFFCVQLNRTRCRRTSISDEWTGSTGVGFFFCFKGARSSCTQNERERTATTPKTYARKHSARKTLAECCNGHSPPQLPDPLSNKRPERDRRLEEREIRVRENQCLTVWLLLLWCSPLDLEIPKSTGSSSSSSF